MPLLATISTVVKEMVFYYTITLPFFICLYLVPTSIPEPVTFTSPGLIWYGEPSECQVHDFIDGLCHDPMLAWRNQTTLFIRTPGVSNYVPLYWVILILTALWYSFCTFLRLLMHNGAVLHRDWRTKALIGLLGFLTLRVSLAFVVGYLFQCPQIVGSFKSVALWLLGKDGELEIT